MKYCSKCKINIVGKRNYCPLCQATLSGIDDEQHDVFPKIAASYKERSVLFKILIFISVVVVTVSIAMNILLPQNGAWSLFIIGAMASIWTTTITALNKRHNLNKNIVYQVFVISVILIIWDYMTHWKGWSINYAIPFMCVAAMIFMFVVSKIRKMHINDYVLYIILNGILGIIPVIFILTGLTKVLYPSLICIVTSIISFSALLIFEWETMISEIKKRLHI